MQSREELAAVIALVLHEHSRRDVLAVTEPLVTGEVAAAVAFAWATHQADQEFGASSEGLRHPPARCMEPDAPWKLMGRIEAVSRAVAWNRLRAHRGVERRKGSK
jgi:hypothetical protein